VALLLLERCFAIPKYGGDSSHAVKPGAMEHPMVLLGRSSYFTECVPAREQNHGHGR
jgi:hypothetical protein